VIAHKIKLANKNKAKRKVPLPKKHKYEKRGGIFADNVLWACEKWLQLFGSLFLFGGCPLLPFFVFG